MTRILHVSDIHCRNEMLRKVLSEEEYDLVVSTGDFECIEAAKLFIEQSKTPYIAVTGNLDHPMVARLLRKHNALIDGRIIEIKGLRVVGIGGMEVVGNINMVKSMAPTRRVHILVTHHPPRGVLDKTYIGLRAGLRELWDIIDLFKPKIHLFGHIHESSGIIEKNGIIFVNPGPLARGHYSIVDLNSGRVELRRLR